MPTQISGRARRSADGAPDRRTTSDDEMPTVASLVLGALGGSEASWVALVSRFEALVWKSVRLVVSDATMREEAAAATWLKVARNLSALREPAAFPGWLRTTAMNEAYALTRRESRSRFEVLTDQTQTVDAYASDPEPESGVLLDDERQMVRHAFEQLSDKCRRLLAALVLEEDVTSYADTAAQLGVPVGSLGPTRRRCLEQLRNSPEISRLAQAWS